MKKILCLALFLPSIAFCRFVDFTDFPAWSEDSIEAVKDAGVMTGYADGTFRPDDSINRAEALTILFRTKNMNIGDTEYVRNFSDVSRDAWFADSVNTAVAEGWIKGYEDGTFRPANSINNAEWATLLLRAFDIEPDSENIPHFSDVPARIWFADAVAAMYANGLIRTDRATFFHPEAQVTRASAAWTISVILRMPRLLGTSQTNDFTGAKIDSRRTAYPRGSDFNPNLQGYDIERSVLKIETNADEEPISILRDADWQVVGQIRLTNALEHQVELSSLELKLRFESTNVGPDRNFEVQVVGPGIDSAMHLDRTGAALFTGLENVIEAGDILALRVKIKPDTEQYFYSQAGEGMISVEQVLGSTRVVLETKEEYGKVIYQSTPVEFVTRQLTPILFTP